jgi:hypothetical protein
MLVLKIALKKKCSKSSLALITLPLLQEEKNYGQKIQGIKKLERKN